MNGVLNAKQRLGRCPVKRNAGMRGEWLGVFRGKALGVDIRGEGYIYIYVSVCLGVVKSTAEGSG